MFYRVETVDKRFDLCYNTIKKTQGELKMEYTRNTIIWTADDEEPDCGICNNIDCDGCCENCGAEFGWKYYEREEPKSCIKINEDGCI